MPRCIGFLSKNSVCDTCASDFGRTSSVLITSFHKKHNTVFDACRADFGLKIAFATPVYRMLVENDSFAWNTNRLRRLASGFWSWITRFHEKSNPLRRLSSGFLSKISVCDTCASDVGPALGFGVFSLRNMTKSKFGTPVERMLVQNHNLRHLCIGCWRRFT